MPSMRDRRDDRVGTGPVQRLDAVRQGVHPRRPGDVGRQGQGELRVVDHHIGLDPRILAGPLVAAVGPPLDGRHLRTGVGGRDRHLTDLDLQGDRLAEAGRRASPDVTTVSAPSSRTIAVAAAALATGTCWATSSKWPTTRPSRRSRHVGRRGRSSPAGDDEDRRREASASSSFDSTRRLPLPNTTRPGYRRRTSNGSTATVRPPSARA